MAQYNFEGDVDNISDRQLEFINQVILERGYENSKVTFAPVGKAGDNYVANVKRITIEGEHDVFTMVVKLAPTHEITRLLMNAGILFKNEHIMYHDVLPKFVQLQKEAGVPEEEQLKYAKCYGSFSEAPNEVIILEDLATLNFTMLDRFVSLTDDCIKSVLKNFAILHSLSYVLKHKEPNVYDEFKTNLRDMWLKQSETPEMKVFFDTLEKQTLSVLEVPDHINLVRHKISNCLDTAGKLAKVDQDSKYTVILQGDSWTNNIMFKFDEDNYLAESLMIDYQLSRNGSPVSDLMYMIFNCTDHETREKHYHDWIDYYHSELDKSLSNFNMKANYIYPRDKLDADLKRYGKLSFGLSICLASMLIRKTEDAAKMKEAMNNINAENIAEQAQEMGVTHLDEESINLFKRRVIGLVTSFTAFGIL